MVSFDSDHSGGDGASPLFLHGQFIFPPPGSFFGGVWEEFFLATLLISGVVDLPCEVP